MHSANTSGPWEDNLSPWPVKKRTVENIVDNTTEYYYSIQKHVVYFNEITQTQTNKSLRKFIVTSCKIQTVQQATTNISPISFLVASTSGMRFMLDNSPRQNLSGLDGLQKPSTNVGLFDELYISPTRSFNS